MNRNDDRKQRAPAAIARPRRKALPLSLSLLGFASSLLPYGDAAAAGPAAGTLPTGQNIVSGAATVNTTGTTLTVNQTSAQLAMNWTSFDIASNASVIFSQPSANAIALNRIGIGAATPTASQIFGNLSANGQVFLINPAGIVFGTGSSINVGGLVASTLDMDPATLAGGTQQFHLDRATATGAVINHGTIQAATGGGVVLAGGSVSNDGMIIANAGHIFMDGADHATLDFDGNNLINVTVTGALSAGSGTAVSNTGSLQADDGMVVLQAAATPGLFTQMVNNGGVIQADSISGTGGTVQLIGSGGAVASSIAISANGVSGGHVQITGDGAVNVSGPVSATGGSGGNIGLSGNALALSGAIDAGAGRLSLTSAGAITQGGGTLSAGTLSGSAGGNVALNQGNQLQAVSNFTAGGNFSLSNNNTLGVSGLSASSGTVALTTAAGADLNLNGNVSATTLTLNSGKNIAQSGGALSAGTLSGSAGGNVTLNQGNQLQAVSNFTGGGNFSLSNNSTLSVSGLSASGGIVALNTAAGADLTLNGDVSANTLTLNSGNNIAQIAGKISAQLLNGQSTGSTALGQANQVAQLGNFSANGFSLSNAQALTVNGPLSSSAGLALTTTAGDLTLAGTVSGSNVALNANSGTIGQTAGVLTANHLSGHASGATTLTQAANQVAQLDSFSANGFRLTTSGALAVNGPLISTGVAALTTTSGDLTLNGTVGGSTLALNANAGAINQAAGTLIGSSLSGSSSGSTTLLQAGNQISLLNGFSANGFHLATSGALSVAGTLSSSGNVALTTASGNLTLVGTVSGTNVALNANAGAINQANGTLSAARLRGSAAGTATLTRSGNQIGQLDGFSANGFNLSSGSALKINGPVTSSAGATVTTTSGDLTVAGAVNGTNVALNANAGAMNGTNVALNANAGAIHFGTSQIDGPLVATASGGIDQNGALSVIGTSAFNAGGAIALNNTSNALSGPVSLAGSSISLINRNDLRINSLSNGANGGVSLFSWTGTLYLPTAPINTGTADLNLVSGGGMLATAGNLSGYNVLLAGSTGLTLGHQLTAANNLSLNSNSGAITQTAGALSAADMSADGAGTVTMTQAANQIGRLNTFHGNGLSFTNGAALVVNGPVTSGGDVALASNGNLTLNGAVSGANVSLNATGGAISQAAGSLTATTLSGSSTGATTLLGTGNQVGQLKGFAADGFSLTNDAALAVNGPLVSTAGVALTTTSGDLTLAGAVNGTNVALNANAGAINQAGGALTAAHLSGSSSAATTLTQAGNQVGQLDGFAANGFSLTNGSALTVNGPVTSRSGATVTTTSGDLNVAGAVSGTNVALNANAGAIAFGASQIGGPLTATASGGISQSGALSVTGSSSFHAGGAIALNNSGNALGGTVDAAGAGIAITNSGDLTIGALSNGANSAVSLVSTSGTLRLPASTIDTGTADLNLMSGGGALATAADLGGANVALSGRDGIALGHRVSAANQLTLSSSGGAIAQTAGMLGAAVLSGSSAGATTLMQAGNQVSQLNGFAANGFSLTNGRALTVNGPLSSAGGVALITTTGDLTLAGAVSGTTVALSANAGAIDQTGGALTTAHLSGSSSAATTLTQAGNQVGQLDGFAANGFSLTSGSALTVNGPVSSGGGVAVTANSGDLTVGGAVSGTIVALKANAGDINFGATQIGGPLTATASGAISQSGPLSVTGASTFNAGGAIGLGYAGNTLGGPVSANGASIAIMTSGDLDIDALNTGANGAVSLIATGGTLSLPAAAINTGSADLTLSSGGALATAADLSGANVALSGRNGIALGHRVSAANNLTLHSSGGAIAQAGGSLAAGVLSGSSHDGTVLNQGNQIQRLGSFSANGFSLTNAQALTVGGPLQSGGAIALTTTGGDLSIDGAVSGASVALNAAGAIGEGANGSIGAASLSGRSGGAAALNQVNRIGSLDGFSADGFSLVNGQGLAVNGAVQGGSSVALTTTSGDLALNAAVSGSQAVLNAAGALVEGNGGSIVASSLSGGSGGSATLAQANHVGSLRGFRSGGDFSFANDGAIQQNDALVVAGASRFQTNGQAIVLTDAGNNLQGAVSLNGGDTQIVNAGALTFGASQIGGNLSAATTANASIGQSGALNVAGTSAFDAGRGAIALNDAGNRFGGAVSASGAGIAIASGGDLSVAQLSNGGHGAVSLSAGGSLHLPSAAIAAGAGDLNLVSGGGALATAGDLSGANVSLTARDGLTLGHKISAANTLNLVGGGAIAQNAGTLVANTLSGQSGGATSLNQANRIGSIGPFSARGFSLTNGQALSIGGPLVSSGDLSLTTTSGGLAITGAASGSHVALDVAGAISEGAGGSLAASVLSGRAGGATTLGTRTQPAGNRIGTLGGFSSPGGFSLTNDQTLTLASVGGSSFSVDTGRAPLYLGVRQGDLLQEGTTPIYDGLGTYAASGRIGTASAPIYVFGSLPQVVEFIGIPPAYFYALDRQGDLLPVTGQLAVNIPTSASSSRAQNGNNRLDSYIDASVFTASYRAFGIVPSGIRLPPGQEACDPDTADCQDD